MGFPSSIWRFRYRRAERDGYLFVHADFGLIIPVLDNGTGSKRPFTGVGLWFHDYGEFEIVTTHCKRSGKNRWFHEYYRIEGDWMQWSNKDADISHERVSDEEVPEDCQVERGRVLGLYTRVARPPYDPDSLVTS